MSDVTDSPHVFSLNEYITFANEDSSMILSKLRSIFFDLMNMIPSFKLILMDKNLSKILTISLISRLIVIFIAVVSDLLLTDHKADAYRNKYHLYLEKHSNDLYSIVGYKFGIIYLLIKSLTKWDAQYFLEISLDGYTSQQHLAFFPGFPYLVTLLRNILFDLKLTNPNSQVFSYENKLLTDTIPLDSLKQYISSCFVAVCVNNFILFPLAAISLFYLTKTVKDRTDDYALSVVRWFCFNPASIFFSSCYTESLFALLTFWFLYTVEHKSIHQENIREEEKKEVCYVPASPVRKQKIQSYTPLSQLNRLLKICIPSIPLMTLACTVRSNGVLTNLFICNQFCFKYFPIFKEANLWTKKVGIIILVEALQDSLLIVITALISLGGFAAFQLFGYSKFCEYIPNTEGLVLKPDWCTAGFWIVPISYAHIQSKYWNVGLFKYYQVKQLPNFLLTLPTSLLIFYGTLEYRKHLNSKISTKKNSRLHIYYIQSALFVSSLNLAANVQVTTRLVASFCPLLYWICADLAEKSPSKKLLIVVFFLFYFVVGTVLHTNFYPWT